METGNYAGASHALREIIKYAPEYENAAQLLAIVKQRQAEQRNRLLYSLLGAVLFVCIGSFLQISSDLVLLALAVVGLLVGYGAANVLRSFRRS